MVRRMESVKAMGVRAKVVRVLAGAAAAGMLAALVHVIPARARVESRLTEVEAKESAENAPSESSELKGQIIAAQKKAMAEKQNDANSAEFQAQLAAVRKRMDEVLAKMRTPRFERLMEDAQQKAGDRAAVEKQIAKARLEMAAATVQMNRPEFKAKMARVQREAMVAQGRIESGEIQKQMSQARQQMAAAMARVNSAQAKAAMEKAQRAAREAQKKIESGAIQKQTVEAQSEMQRQLDSMKAQEATSGK